ncbi:hypothetical protein [Candidatus Poriferisodalis sp.]|uniref:hypothetical protein n=1 Tax=Candidatus Poriferisodalis sp. TaxID=3101277 RepID=UPI003C701739
MSGTNMSKRRVVVWPQGDLVRRVMLDGVEVVLERRAGVWAVVDEEVLASETALLETLGQPNEALGRARGVTAALNASLVRPDQLSGLVRRLAWLWIRRPYGYWHLAFDERDALAVACAHLGSDAAWEFVSWVLAKRLERALWRTPWRLPGWSNWTGEGRWEFDTQVGQRLGAGFFDTMAAHSDRRFRDVATATDPDADPRRLGELAGERDRQIRDLVAVNPSTPVEALKKLGCKTAHSFDDVCVRLRVLQNPSTPAWLVAEAAVGRVEEFYARQTWRGGSAEVFQQIFAAMHPRAPARLLRDLASHSDPTVRATVGRAPRAPVRVLEALAPSLDTEVRVAVAANPASPARLLDALAADPHRSVRAAASANHATPPVVLERLSRDRVVLVRRRVAANCATPPGVLRGLCEDPDSQAAAEAAANPATDRTDMAGVAERLACDSHWWARLIAAGMPETPVRLLERLATDPHRHVREATARNLRTPLGALRAIAECAQSDEDLDTLGALLDNDALDAELRKQVGDAYVTVCGPPPENCTSPADRRRWTQR